jgi:hypothetical protein
MTDDQTIDARPVDPATSTDLTTSTDPAAAPSTQVPAAEPHAGLRYAVLRITMLIIVGGLLYLVGVRGLVWLIATFLASAVASFFLFAGQRQAAARNIELAVTARSHRHDAEPMAGEQPGAAEA